MNGFTKPVLIKKVEGLGLLLPSSNFTVYDVEQNVGEFVVSFLHEPQEGVAKGRGLRPFNVLRTHFSNSSNSSVKIAAGRGGGSRADDLCNSTVYGYIGLYNIAVLIAFSLFLRPIHSNFLLVVKPHDPRFMCIPHLHISTT